MNVFHFGLSLCAMELRVLLFASAKEAVGAAEVKLPASRASTVRELTAALAEAHPALAQLLPSSMILS